MNVDTKTQQKLIDAVREKAKSLRKGVLNAYADAHFGSAQPDDQQFVVWVLQKLMAVGPDGAPNPMYDPYCAPALRYDNGTVGKEIMRRFMKLTGIDLAAIPAPPPPQMPMQTPPMGVQ